MQTVRASEANRQFSSILKQVTQGEHFLIISRRKAVATIAPVKKADSSHVAARKLLLNRLTAQKVTGARDWTRDELYECS